jgi:hypothetical protein
MRGMEEARVALRFLYHWAREGVPWWHTARWHRERRWLLWLEEDGDRGVCCGGREGRWAWRGLLDRKWRLSQKKLAGVGNKIKEKVKWAEELLGRHVIMGWIENNSFWAKRNRFLNWFKGLEFKIQRFKYFKTKFELSSN